jgi:uncharacterized protein YjiS (DUF1127 family)
MTAIDLRPCDGCPPAASRRPVSSHIAIDLLREAVRRAVHTLRLWRRRARERNELARLNEHMLADIGLTPADRDFLVNKPFWRE